MTEQTSTEGVRVPVTSPELNAAALSVVYSMMPPFPSATVVPPAEVPAPPLLDEELEGRPLALLLVRIYRQVYESRYGKPCWYLAKGDIARSRLYLPLLAAGHKLRETKTPPAAWAAWSFDIWLVYGQANMAPKMDWVYGKARITKALGWYRSEGSKYERTRAYFTKEHAALLRRWYGMVATALRGTPPEEAARRFFPGGTYDDMVADARRASAVAAEKFRALAAKGEWLW